MARHLVRLVACLALVAGSVSLSSCVLLPGGGWYGNNDHHDYISHDN